ncbi:MAG TPA: sialidase family protein, partial [Tepidisphaeraceae bacterium]
RMFCVLVILCVAVAAVHAAPASTSVAPEEIRVFEPKDNGYASCRIPGLAMTTNGTLLAWCEARHAKGGDWDPIEILLRRSTDGGRTWGEIQHIAGDGKQTYNNPVAIVDRDGGAIHFLYCVEYARCFSMRSDDDGRTFSAPVEITGTFEAFRKDYAWNVIATGPCHGIQLRSGRLLVPVWLSTGGHSHHPSVVATIYSDDRGKTWQRGDIAVRNTMEVPNPNETVAVELANGRVMLNCRNESPRHRRVIVTSPDGATGWSAPAFDDALVEPICNASIIRLTTAPPGDRNRIVFANPDNDVPPPPSAKRPSRNGVQSYARKDLTLRLSYDEGKTWPVSKLLDSGPTDYCDLAAGRDGTIYCLHRVAKGLTLARIPLGWFAEP